VNSVVDWTKENRFQLNNEKCKELRISFSKNHVTLPPLVVQGQLLDVVDSTKLLGVTISCNLTWNAHVAEVVKRLQNVFTS